MDRLRPELCVRCRGGRYLCGLAYCPLLARRLSAPHRLGAVRELRGASPPSLFVGRVGYPKVRVYPAAPPELGDTTIYEDPARWLGLPLERFVAMRLSLYRASLHLRVEDAANPPRALQEIQLAVLSQRPVDAEVEFAREPRGAYLSEYAPPMGPAAPAKSIRFTTEPKLPRKAEELYGDREVKAREAVVELYEAGLDVSYIARVLSAGALGRRRRLVPTRWAITAVDKIVSDHLLERVKEMPEVDGYYLYARRTVGNLFIAILAPSRWAYEWGEAFEPHTVWNPGEGVEVEVDYELYGGRRDYPEIGGCYYAARLAVAEALLRMKRQAAAVLWREVYTGFTLPVGVWWVRENVRAMFREPPARFDTLEDALEAASYLLKIPVERWLAKSRLVHLLRSRVA
ncbi:Nre family DNA repair protein [Pyrobaculum sp. 3827-6]|uniref:Nre family DNA repair protein n=1 Tax=Pyrobaculum sp. 3827-6 TaxID=2983604 RepID=UPI0021DA312D|nr:Nre family DNA repair protein [Pyrobaculum sp. 3827-6]MCU7788503.1 Nre family DNA repair protein [Pyrobaculum sp. 3827-6]